jgi:four helix bundle protein
VRGEKLENSIDGSLMEVMCQLEVSLLLGYISQQQFDEQELFVAEITKMLVGLRKTFEDKV